ncbi:MAG: glycogen debranching protein GlgX [Paracoccaceae bacterium]
MSRRLGAGRPEPLGLTLTASGANVAVVSGRAERIELCLFEGDRDTERIALPERTGAVWHAEIPGIGEGQRYGFRAHGPWAPEAGACFAPQKLLLDPYARMLDRRVVASPAFAAADPSDTGAQMAKCVATRPLPAIDPVERPETPWDRTVIYEAHANGLTRLWPGLPAELAGTVEALAEPAVVAHLKGLGVTAIELLPLHAATDEPHLRARGLSNYWGYNSVGFFAPEPSLLGPNGVAGLRETVRRLHAAGLEVILDVVYNHTGEGDADGPMLSFRGLDDGSYYRREPDGAYANDTGCGNTVDLASPPALRLVLSSLRYWAERIGIDGFRFDLAPALTRGADGTPGASPFLAALLQDPVLTSRKLIAEPWDIGPEGYRLGAFPAPIAEWNDRFRDSVRGFWQATPGAAAVLADGLLGSGQIFDRGSGRRPWSSVNYVACHDGFTLADLTMFAEKRNTANGEDNRDGNDHNLSDNLGVEGPSDDPAIRAARAGRQRVLVATALLAQGTPMLRAGDEIGQSQGGNNNVYCQDNPTAWIDWAAGDRELETFVRDCLALRAAEPALRQAHYLHGEIRADGTLDAAWSAPGGGDIDWEAGEPDGLALLLRGAATGLAPDRPVRPVLLVLNRSDARLERPLPEGRWTRRLDTADPRAPRPEPGPSARIAAQSLVVFVAESP